MNDACITLSIYSRPECHLCDELVDGLRSWQSRYLFEIEIVDISADADLTARYAARIPVLACGETEICQYFLDDKQLQQFLAKSAVKSQSVQK